MNENHPTPENRKYFDRLTFYHPTSSGTGTSLRLDFRLRRPEEERESCFFLELAKQKTSAGRTADGERVRPTFDWANKIVVKLGLMDACELLTVLEGRCEQLRGGKGLFHDSGEATTVFQFRRQSEPPGYVLDVSRKPKGENAEAIKTHILLSEAEAIAVRLYLQHAIGLLSVAEPLSRLFHLRPQG